MSDTKIALIKLLDTHRQALNELKLQQAELGPAASNRAAIVMQIRKEQEEIERITQMLENLEPTSAFAGQTEIERLRDELSRWQAVITLEVLDRTELKLSPLEMSIAKMQESIDQLLERIMSLEGDVVEIKRELQYGNKKNYLDKTTLIIWAVMFSLALIVVVALTVRLAA